MMIAVALFIAVGLSNAEITDITGDGKVQKAILVQGKGGAKPLPNQKVEIRYTGWLPDGKVFDSSNAKGGTFTFVVGRGVIPAWSLAVQTMTVGEKAKITTHYQYGYGERGYPPIIPARAELTFEIELVNIVPE
jgi:FKBP-type peptidyl-prolyl cis-trans isomerase